MTYVGIDVSKTTFVVAYSSAKGNKTNSFKNTIKGIHEFIQTIVYYLIVIFLHKVSTSKCGIRPMIH